MAKSAKNKREEETHVLPAISDAEVDEIQVFGAREHNLKDIDISIPRNKLVVVTGISGSGKSSLAFDTIYAEGQRRYMESFSAYARQFIGGMERPDVEKIDGLSPVISIEQKTTNKNPRSTVGTITEIYDFLRLLFARIGEAYSYNTGKRMVRYSEQQVVDLILEQYANKKLVLLAPLVKGRKGHYRELFEQIRKQGYVKVRVDGVVKDLVPKMQVDRYKVHDIEVVVDRVKVTEDFRLRITESVATCMRLGKGMLLALDHETGEVNGFSKLLMCPDTGISYEEPSPNTFSFNSPYGYCKSCKGLGFIHAPDPELVIPDSELSIKKKGLAPLGASKKNYTFDKIEAIAAKYDFKLTDPIKDIPKEALDVILHGTMGETLTINKSYNGQKTRAYQLEYEGIYNTIKRCYYEKHVNEKLRRWAEGFMSKEACPTCEGQRLSKPSLHFKLGGQNIADLGDRDIVNLNEWLEQLPEQLSERQIEIAHELLKEIKARVGFLLDVGLDYLHLSRPSRSLSGGESQRIRLATQIGSQLVGITYILDEPSIGLHQRDNHRLITALRDLTGVGNTVLVVEHDRDIMLASDYLIDIGPGAGKFGGQIVGQGHPEEFKKDGSPTARFLNGEEFIAVPETRRKGSGKKISLKGCTGHNLKNISVDFPLGTLICVTGVSGSGKSTLINETFYPILNKHFYRAVKRPLPYKSIKGLEHLDKVIEIDQSPIGRTPRSNPATYIGLFTPIRQLFTQLPEAMIRGYKPGRFSFNVKGGRCEECGGGGMKVIEMNFLPDVHVECEQCRGKRYNRETLEIRYKGKSISDVLNMTVDEAVVFFEPIPKIYRMIKTLQDVGLGYITLGQPATTLSGGEAQRVKLSSELRKRDTGKTCYILDEPTTGLHFKDIKMLLEVIQKIVDRGNTVIIIEHNMDVIKVADHIIDIGPEGGRGGGQVLFAGTPEKLTKVKESHTGRFLIEELKS